MREVKAKQLPELDDELATEAGFDTLDELKDDIRSRLAENETQRIEMEFREAALDAAVAAATIEVPEAPDRGACPRDVGLDAPLALAPGHRPRRRTCGCPASTEEDTIEQAKPDADQALRREAVLAAVAEAESLEPSEEEMLEAVARRAARREDQAARSCWSACAPTGASTASKTTLRSARRGTWWPSPPSPCRAASDS